MSAEVDPAINTLRRVDLVVRFSVIKNTLRVFCFTELKKHGASPALIKECESQAMDACRRHMESHNQDNVYVLTVYGTCAKAWMFEKEDKYLTALDPDVSQFDENIRTATLRPTPLDD